MEDFHVSLMMHLQLKFTMQGAGQSLTQGCEEQYQKTFGFCFGGWRKYFDHGSKMPKPFKVSQSKVNAWRDCKLKYHLQHVEHLKPRVPPRPLKFGSIIHKLQETIAKDEDPFETLDQLARQERRLFLEEQELYGDIITDIRYIINAYLNYWEEPLKFILVNREKTEHSFEIALTNEIVVKGRIDGLVRHKGFKALLEHKSHKNFPNDDHRWRNLQSVVYIRIADMMGWAKLDGTLWNYIRSKSPTRPQLLKSGQMSERALDSLPQVVIDTLVENGLKPSDYTEMIKTQYSNLHTWFQRIFTPVKPEVTKKVFYDFISTSREMVDYYDKTTQQPPRTIARHCDWCRFEPICRAELQGNDVEWVREHQFVFDETEYQEEPSEE